MATTWWQGSKETKGRGEETEETGMGTVERRNKARRDAPRRVEMSFRAGLFVPTRHQRSAASESESELKVFRPSCTDCMRCPPFLKPLRAQSVTTFAGRYYTTSAIPEAGPSKPVKPSRPPATQDEQKRKRRTDWKRRQNVSGT